MSSSTLPRSYTMRPPGRKQWSGLRMPCPICYQTMDHVLVNGRECYECPDCLEAYGERQLELFEGLVP